MKNQPAPSPETTGDANEGIRGMIWLVLSLLLFALVFVPLLIA